MPRRATDPKSVASASSATSASDPDEIILPILSARRPAVICLTPSSGAAAPGLPGATRPCRRRCGETEPAAFTAQPGPLTLLPVARSPSRPRRRGRWWALTPPVRPLPAPERRRESFLLRLWSSAALAGLPPLAVSWGDCAPSGTGSREVPLDSLGHPATAPSSAGRLYHDSGGVSIIVAHSAAP